MNLAFEDRILAERAKLRSSAEALWDRVEKGNPGKQSRAVMKKTLDNESNGESAVRGPRTVISADDSGGR